MVTPLLWLGANALVVAALVPVVWLLCRLLRSRPAAQHLLWFLLLLKLVAPPVLDWPWSVDLSVSSLTAEAQSMAPIHTGAPIALDGEYPLDLASEFVGDETIATPLASEISTTTGVSAPRLSIASVTVLVWSVGALVMLIFMVVGLWRQRQIVRNSVDAAEHLVTAVRRIAGDFGLRTPRVAVSDQIHSPAVCCLGTPRLIWPATMTAKNVVADCDGVVAHELAHLARRDHYFLYAELVVTVCCWWNPLMWIIRRRLCETRELACDARALAAVEQPRSDYAQRLLNLSVSRPGLLLVAPAFGAGNVSRRFLRRRLIMVFDERIHGRISAGGILLAAVLIAVGLPGFTLADPPTDPNSAGASGTASTTSAAQSAASSATNNSDATVADPDEPRTITGRSLRLSKVIKSDEISADKPAEISLGSGGTIRITKNDQGDLVVTVEQTEVIESPRRRRIVINRTGAEELASEPGRASVTTSRGGSGSASSFGSGSLRSETAAPDLDRELLRSDVELAEVNLMEQRVKLRITQKENVDASQRDLAELAVRRAEIELKRAQLRLSRGESTLRRR